MAFTFEQIFAADPANPSNIAQNAAVTIFAPGDGTMTPLTITDPDGQPLANPLTVNANGFGSAFAHATLDRVAWAGGGFTGFFTSYEGMKQVAVDAQAAAEAAAATAGADAAAVATAAIGDATDEATAAAASAATAASNASASATAAANSAALVGAPADTAVETLIYSASATKAALNATYGPAAAQMTSAFAGQKHVKSPGYLMACFRAVSGDLGGDQRLSVLWSQDGKTFNDASYAPVYTPTGPKVVRDPSIIFKDGVFYIAHTNTGATGTSFDIIKSTDLINWTLVTTVDVSSIGSVTNTWAPELQVDDNGDVYAFFSINVTNPYYVKATSADLSTWAAPVALTITGRPAQVIDPVFIKKGATWYCFYKREDATSTNRLIYRATSSTLTGTYTTDKTGDWAGWGSNLEGPSIVQLHDGTYRMYLDEPNATTNLSSYYYSDSADLETWTAKLPVGRYPGDVPYKFRHGTVLTLTDAAAQKATNFASVITAARFTGPVTDQNQTAPAGVYAGMATSGGNSYPKLQLANGSTNLRIGVDPNGEVFLDKPGVANSDLVRYLNGRARFGSAVQPKSYTTATRPTGWDSSVAGALLWDSTLNAHVYWDGSHWIVMAPNTARAQYNSSQTITNTAYADFGLSVNFTPRGTKALVRLDGILSTVASSGTGLCNFQFAITGATAGTVTPQGGLYATTTQDVRSASGISTVFGSLIPGVEVTLSVKVKVDSNVTAYCRPSTNSYEFLTITASDVA